MACVLPRIDSGAAYPTRRLPTGHAPAAHGKPKQPPAIAAAVAKAGGASPQARSESANNTDIGGASGGFFNEAEAGAGNSWKLDRCSELTPCLTSLSFFSQLLAPCLASYSA